MAKRTCKWCRTKFEPTSDSQRYCTSCGGGAPKGELEGGPGVGGHNTGMPLSEFPHRAFADVRHRIINQNIQPSSELLVARVRAVGEATRERDAQGLRAALADLAATSIQAAGHKQILKIMGAGPPAVPIRRGRS